MRAYSTRAVLQRTLFLLIPVAVAAWFIAVPRLLNQSSFLAFVGLLAAFICVGTITYMNARPASSLAQSLYDAEAAAAAARPRDAIKDIAPTSGTGRV